MEKTNSWYWRRMSRAATQDGKDGGTADGTGKEKVETTCAACSKRSPRNLCARGCLLRARIPSRAMRHCLGGSFSEIRRRKSHVLHVTCWFCALKGMLDDGTACVHKVTNLVREKKRWWLRPGPASTHDARTGEPLGGSLGVRGVQAAERAHLQLVLGVLHRKVVGVSAAGRLSAGA